MMIRLTGMYEKKSQKTGLRYYTGRLNMGSRMLLMQNLRAGEGDPPWELFIADAENTLTRDQIATWKTEHGKIAARIADAAGGNIRAPKKRRGRPPKVKLEHGEDPDDGFPDWLSAG